MCIGIIGYSVLELSYLQKDLSEQTPPDLIQAGGFSHPSAQF